MFCVGLFVRVLLFVCHLCGLFGLVYLCCLFVSFSAVLFDLCVLFVVFVCLPCSFRLVSLCCCAVWFGVPACVCACLFLCFCLFRFVCLFDCVCLVCWSAWFVWLRVWLGCLV